MAQGPPQHLSHRLVGQQFYEQEDKWAWPLLLPPHPAQDNGSEMECQSRASWCWRELTKSIFVCSG